MLKKHQKNDKNDAWEGSWGDLGAILAPRWPQEPQGPRKVISGAPSWGPSWGPKSIKIDPKSDPKCDHFYDRFEDRFLERFGANLAPSWPPKPSQNGVKLAPKSIQVGVLIWELFLKGCWHHFYWFLTTTWHGRSSKKYTKTICFLTFLNFWLLRCWDDLLIDFWSILGLNIEQKSIKNR